MNKMIMTKVLMHKAIILMIVILAFLPSVFSIGISPAQKDWIYQLESQHYELKIVNNEKKDMDVILSAAGTLRDYIKFDLEKISFTKEDNIKIVGYTATLLSELESGSNEGRIIAEETIPNARFGESYVTAKLNVVSIVRVEVPLKDKLILAKLDIFADNNNVNVKAIVTNKGTKEIDALSASFVMQDDDKPIATKVLPARQLKENKNDELKAIFNAKDITPGLYSATATLNYDGNSLKLTKLFQIGAVTVNINDFDKVFTEKKINEFNINLESSWNQELKNLYAEVFIFRNGKEMASFKGVSFDLKPLEKKRIKLFFDANNLATGEYDTAVIVHYDKGTSKKEGKINIISTEEYNKQQEGGINYLMIALIVLIMILVIILIIALIYGVMILTKISKK